MIIITAILKYITITINNNKVSSKKNKLLKIKRANSKNNYNEFPYKLFICYIELHGIKNLKIILIIFFKEA